MSLRGTYILGCASNSQNPSDIPFHTVPTSLHPAARAWLSLARFWRFREKLCMNRSSSLLNMQSLHVAKILVLSQDLIAVRLVRQVCSRRSDCVADCGDGAKRCEKEGWGRGFSLSLSPSPSLGFSEV